MRPLRESAAKGPVYTTGGGPKHERSEANAHFQILPFGFIHAALLDEADGFYGARIISIVRPSPRAPSPDATRGTNHEEFDFLSHRTDRWAVNFLPRVWSERRPDDSPAARLAIFFANVRASFHPSFRSLSPCRARLSGLRSQRLAGPENIRVPLRSHCGNTESLHRSARSHPLHPLHAGLRWSRRLSHDLGSPGPSRSSHHPGREIG